MMRKLLVLLTLAGLGYWIYKRSQPPDEDWWVDDLESPLPVTQS